MSTRTRIYIGIFSLLSLLAAIQVRFEYSMILGLAAMIGILIAACVESPTKASEPVPATASKSRTGPLRLVVILATGLVILYAWAYFGMVEKTYYCLPDFIERGHANDLARIERFYGEREPWLNTFFAPAAWVESILRNTEVRLLDQDRGPGPQWDDQKNNIRLRYRPKSE